MIKLQNLTPEVYYNQSRDFQFIGRLYDVLFNSIKTNSDAVSNLHAMDTLNAELIDLLAMTLGFKSSHQYNVKQLVSLCSVFSEILKHKGTLYAVQIACNAIINAEGIKIDSITENKINNLVEIDWNDSNNILIFLPQELSDTSLLSDILDYILPAGMTCEFIKEVRVTYDQAKTVLVYSQDVNKWIESANEVSIIPTIDSGLLEPHAEATPGLFVNSNTLATPIINNTETIVEEGEQNE